MAKPGILELVDGAVQQDMTRLRASHPLIGLCRYAVASRRGLGRLAPPISASRAEQNCDGVKKRKLVEPSGIEPLTSCMPCRKLKQLRREYKPYFIDVL
ncbi:MAG TPA: hypothetical protein VHZ32_18690 [Rhizomicrobium sp.]|jgi:hypothetical protein|nr:hypothetical protein [Rhizomicrobium sp.]